MTAVAGLGLGWLLQRGAVPRRERGSQLMLDAPSQQSHAPRSWPDAPAGWEVTLTEHYRVDALVMSKKRYRLDRFSEIAPLDLALAWGIAAKPQVQDKLSISQSNRWYYWRAKELLAPAHILNAHMANVHIVPARPALKTILLGERAKDLVSLRGHLIDARHVESNTVFRSSRTRTDTGAGACEILLVTEVGLL
jgi:hypothetical protein